MRVSSAFTVRSMRRISFWNVGWVTTSSTEAIGDLRQLLHPPSRALGRRADDLHAPIDGGGESLDRRLAVLDELAQHAQRQEPALPPLLLEDDLRKGDGRQVLAAVVLEDLHFLARLHPPADLVEGDVATLAGIVELTVAVAFDEPRHLRARLAQPRAPVQPRS